MDNTSDTLNNILEIKIGNFGTVIIINKHLTHVIKINVSRGFTYFSKINNLQFIYIKEEIKILSK